MKIIIRNETETDFREVEELTKKAFWNVNEPGCNEHYLVHTMRNHADFIPELDFVLETDGKIVANIMYTKSILTDENGDKKEILTFGPLSVLPDYQRMGFGKKLLAHSFEKASGMGFDTVVILGNPENYISSGFKNGKRFCVSLDDDYYPVALLVKELKPGVLSGKKWTYSESTAYEIDQSDADEFDKSFEPMEKAYRPSQELFYIYSRSKVVG